MLVNYLIFKIFFMGMMTLVVHSPLSTSLPPPPPPQQNYNTPMHFFNALVIEIEQVN